ncbi:hypothetical protein Tco_0215473 [Tanacetum coccineum]
MNNALIKDFKVKGVTTRGGKTTTQDGHNSNTDAQPDEHLVVDLDEQYAKFLKGLLTNKARLEEACKITMNERSSVVLLNKLPAKEKDPGSFTIPCDIGHLHIDNALADLGAKLDAIYDIDDLDDIINKEAQEILANKEADSFLSRGLEKSID